MCLSIVQAGAPEAQGQRGQRGSGGSGAAGAAGAAQCPSKYATAPS